MSTIGAAPGNRWTLAEGAVDLVRAVPASRPARLACQGVDVTFDRAASAIVVIDMQNAFCHPDQAGADGPARRPIAANFQRSARRRRQIRRVFNADLVRWIKPIEMRNMAMILFRSIGVPILPPFLQLPLSSDLIGCQARARRFQFCH